MSLGLHYRQTAQQILQGYKGQTPFAPVLRQYFASQKKYGSRDRKAITQLCYAWLRCGRNFPQLSIEEQLLHALFFCTQQPQTIFKQLKPEWNKWIEGSVEQKAENLGLAINPALLFPWQSQLCKGIDGHEFSMSILQQPNLFLRIRTGKQEAVLKKLLASGENYTHPSPNSICLPNATKAEAIFALNEEVVVQDFSSQQTGILLTQWLNKFAKPNPINKVWDACAASGGKSIMLYDILPRFQLTVSDIRSTILNNLKNRFKEAGISGYQSFLADISKPGFKAPGAPFDLIITDVPCTGSGTWARTPEQLVYFEVKAIAQFAETQYQIAKNAIIHLKPGGYLCYITCSVFEAENSSVVNRLLGLPNTHLINSQLINGVPFGADSMFIALLQLGG